MLCEKFGFLICLVRISDKFISRLMVQPKDTEAKDDGSEQGLEGLLVKEC